MRMVNASRPPEKPLTQGTQASGGATLSKSHRIAPTKVQHVERKPQFAAVVEDRGSAKKHTSGSPECLAYPEGGGGRGGYFTKEYQLHQDLGRQSYYQSFG